MKTQYLTKTELVGEILLVMKANNVPDIGDGLLALAFRSESELRDICHALHIKVTK